MSDSKPSVKLLNLKLQLQALSADQTILEPIKKLHARYVTNDNVPEKQLCQAIIDAIAYIDMAKQLIAKSMSVQHHIEDEYERWRKLTDAKLLTK